MSDIVLTNSNRIEISRRPPFVKLTNLLFVAFPCSLGRCFSLSYSILVVLFPSHTNTNATKTTELKADDLVMKRGPSPMSQPKLLPPISTPSSLPLNPTNTLPPPLQNVEQFGPILGEEIVSNWRKTIERNVINSINNIHHKKINNLIHNNALMSMNHNNNNIDINNKNIIDPKLRQNGIDLMINKEVMTKSGNNFHSDDKLVNGKILEKFS